MFSTHPSTMTIHQPNPQNQGHLSISNQTAQTYRHNRSTGNLDELTQQVLELPLEQRSQLAEKLLESLDEPAPEKLEQVWAAEAERRYLEFEDGSLFGVSALRP